MILIPLGCKAGETNMLIDRKASWLYTHDSTPCADRQQTPLLVHVYLDHPQPKGHVHYYARVSHRARMCTEMSRSFQHVGHQASLMGQAVVKKSYNIC